MLADKEIESTELKDKIVYSLGNVIKHLHKDEKISIVFAGRSEERQDNTTRNSFLFRYYTPSSTSIVSNRLGKLEKMEDEIIIKILKYPTRYLAFSSFNFENCMSFKDLIQENNTDQISVTQIEIVCKSSKLKFLDDYLTSEINSSDIANSNNQTVQKTSILDSSKILSLDNALKRLEKVAHHFIPALFFPTPSKNKTKEIDEATSQISDEVPFHIRKLTELKISEFNKTYAHKEEEEILETNKALMLNGKF